MTDNPPPICRRTAFQVVTTFTPAGIAGCTDSGTPGTSRSAPTSALGPLALVPSRGTTEMGSMQRPMTDGDR